MLNNPKIKFRYNFLLWFKFVYYENAMYLPTVGDTCLKEPLSNSKQSDGTFLKIKLVEKETGTVNICTNWIDKKWYLNRFKK